MTHAIKDFIGLGRARGRTAPRILSRVAFWLLAGGVSVTALFGQCAPSGLTFTNQSVASGTYLAAGGIIADAGNGSGTTTIGIGASVTFQAGYSITLLPSFHAAIGSSFQASIVGAVPAVSPTAISLLAGGGSECVTVVVAPGTSWSASSNASWITFPSGSTGTGNATLTFQAAQNTSSSSGQSGAITVTSAAGSATVTVSEAALASGGPTVALANQLTDGSLPSSPTQTLTFTFGSPNGSGYLSSLAININILDGGEYACTMEYYPQSNVLYFLNAGSVAGYTLGTQGQQATGDHCILDVGNSSVSLNPSSATASVTMSLALTLQPSAVGTQNVYLNAIDDAWNYSSYLADSVASWTAFNLVTANPPTTTMTAPTTAASQVLHYQISEGNGYTYLMQVDGTLALSSSALASNSPCSFSFGPPNNVSLYQYANGTATLLGFGTIGGGFSYPSTNGILGGSGGLPGPGTCSIDLNQSSVSTGTDGTGILQNPNSGTPWQPVTTVYLDLWTGLDSTAQSTLPLNMYVLPIDYSTDYAYFSYAGTWGSALPPVTAINSFPAGLQITVDGGPPSGSVCTAPCTFQDGLSHNVAVASPQQRSGDPAGVQYQFASWSDGGAQSHTILPGANVTANFNTWFQLTTGSSTGGSVVVGALSGTVVAPLTPTQLAAGWYPAGTSFWVTGLATQGYAFINLSNGLTQQYVVLNGPMTVTANFTNNVITLQSSTQVVVPNNGKRITAQYAVTSGDASLLSACTSNDPYLYGTIDGVTGGTIEISYGDNGGEPGSDPITCYCSFGYCAVAFVPPVGVVEAPTVIITGPQGVPKGGSNTFTVNYTGLGDTITLQLGTSQDGTGSATFANGTNTTTLTFGSGSNLQQTVTVQGVQASTSADDVTISAWEYGGQLDSQQFSVVTVAIKLNTGQPVEGTETSQWVNFIGIVGGPDPGLGAEILYNTGYPGGEPVTGPHSCIVGVELVGAVTPADYPGPVTLRRWITGTAVFQGQTLVSSSGSTPDNSASTLVNNAVGSGAAGDVFDLDPPGIGPGPLVTTPQRFRTNFSEYAVLGDYYDQNPPQAGASFPYSVAVSCGGTSDAPALDYTYGLSGDNSAAPYTIQLTYNLAAPGN